MNDWKNDWKQVIRNRLWQNISRLNLPEETKRQVLEDELARVVLDTKAGRPLTTEPEGIFYNEDDDSNEENA
jgi:hypothetical protein